MRWLFLLLLSANVGMLVWSVQQHKDVEPQLTKEAGVGNLRLVTQREQSLASIMPPADEGRDEPEPVLPEPEIAYATPDAEPAGSQTTDDVVQNDAETSTAEPGAALEPVTDEPDLLGDAPILQPQQMIAFDVDQRRPRRRTALAGKNAPMAVWPYLPDGGYGPLLPGDGLGNEGPESQQATAEAEPVNDAPTEEATGNEALADASETETADRPAISSAEGSHDVQASLIESAPPAVAEEPAAAPAEQKQLTALGDPLLPEPAVARTVEVCGVLGPIDDDAMARSLVNVLQDKGVGASLRQELQQRVKGYWVIVPPLKNRRAAIAMEQKLLAEGVSDVLRFYKGKMRNGVSLGMYSRKRNADKRMRRIAAKGFNVEVRARTKEIPVHMIDYRAEKTLNEQALRGVQEKYPNLEHNSQACPQIVSS